MKKMLIILLIVLLFLGYCKIVNNYTQANLDIIQEFYNYCEEKGIAKSQENYKIYLEEMKNGEI